MRTQQWMQHSKRQHSTTFTVTYSYHDRISTTLASTSSIPGHSTHATRIYFDFSIIQHARHHRHQRTTTAQTQPWTTPEPTPIRVAARYRQPPHCRTHHRHLQDQLGTTSPTSSIDAAAAAEPFDKHAPQQHSAVLYHHSRITASNEPSYL